MELFQSIIWSIAVVLGIILLGVFALLAFAMNAYYSTDEGRKSIQSAKDKKKKL